jgi:DNA-binding IclR family transcriptional regulator
MIFRRSATSNYSGACGKAFLADLRSTEQAIQSYMNSISRTIRPEDVQTITESARVIQWALVNEAAKRNLPIVYSGENLQPADHVAIGRLHDGGYKFRVIEHFPGQDQPVTDHTPVARQATREEIRQARDGDLFLPPEPVFAGT